LSDRIIFILGGQNPDSNPLNCVKSISITLWLAVNLRRREDPPQLEMTEIVKMVGAPIVIWRAADLVIFAASKLLAHAALSLGRAVRV